MVQPEMREPLLKLQELHRDGTMDKNFAVVTNPIAREYIAGGKAGLWYANGSSVVHSQNTLVKPVSPQSLSMCGCLPQ
jgi:hypothetical protein